MRYLPSNMETQFIQAPSAELRILDLGQQRRIFVKGLAVHAGKKTAVTETIDTPYTQETLRLLVRLKGDWWLDELERRSQPKYIRQRLEGLIQRFGSLSGAKVLDMGSGSGSSALVMLDCGAQSVHGVEPNPDFVALANQRAQEENLADKTNFIQIIDTSSLPFDDQKFDLITFNAVLEHIAPHKRPAILQEAWRCLKPDGLLVVTETPNKLFPYDGHTTHLPLLPWLPLGWAISLAKKYSRNSPRGLTKEQYISEGIVGSSFWEIKKALPQAICLNLQGGDARWKISLKPKRILLSPILGLGELLLRAFKIPLAACLPVLDLVFKK